MKYIYIFFVGFSLSSCNQISNPVGKVSSQINDEELSLIVYEVDLDIDNIDFFWKDEQDRTFGNAKELSKYLINQRKELIFATNGGMYLKDQYPQGLYVENGDVKKVLDTVQSAFGNFYMQPNGVFYITDSKSAKISESTKFINENVKYATQSGPMLVIDGALHPKFKANSTSKFIRNGVGILPNGGVLFVMSKEPINFFNFATYFKDRGCNNALYLDGFVSRTYLPSENWKQLDGSFGVMIGVCR